MIGVSVSHLCVGWGVYKRFYRPGEGTVRKFCDKFVFEFTHTVCGVHELAVVSGRNPKYEHKRGIGGGVRSLV